MSPLTTIVQRSILNGTFSNEQDTRIRTGLRVAVRVGVKMGMIGSCRLCAGELMYAFSAREMMLGTRDAFDYLECLGCGALQIAAPPENLDRYYAGDYYTDRQQGLGGPAEATRILQRAWSRTRIAGGPFVRFFSGRRYARFDWFRRTDTKLDDAILDVGCGSGRLLLRMARLGFTQLSGIDPRWSDRDAASSGVRLARQGPEDHRGRYRLVMAHHSFEHMLDPVKSFDAMARLVDQGGHLLLRVPLADSWARHHYGADWVQLDAPRHLQIPTRRSIEILAQRVGLRIVHVEDDSGPFQIWGSELYRGDHPLNAAGRGGRRELSVWRRLRARWQARGLSRAGIGDQASFYLRRDPPRDGQDA